MATKLKIICAWCGKDMGEKDGKGQTGVTSGMCQQCWERLFPGRPYPTRKHNNTYSSWWLDAEHTKGSKK